MKPTCSFCGAQPDGDDLPLTWSTAIERGRPQVVCEACTRANARSIEAKLDSEWW